VALDKSVADKHMRRSFLYAALSGFCVGIGLIERWSPPAVFIVGSVVLVAVMLTWRRTVMVGIFLLAALVAQARWNMIWSGSANSVAQLANQRVILSGTVYEPPTTRGNNIVAVAGDVTVSSSKYQGKVKLWLYSDSQVKTGERLTVRCLGTPLSQASRWRDLSHDVRVQGREVEIEGRRAANWSPRLQLSRVQEYFSRTINQNFQGPRAALLKGILFGRQEEFTPELSQQFIATGTSHIVALSGFNVTIILNALAAALQPLLGRRYTVLIVAAVLIGFIAMTGAAASVVRAGLMTMVAQAALLLGRPVAMDRLLAYTGLLMVWQNPLILWHDLGFQLSFLATLGLVYVSPVVQQWWRWLPNQWGLRETLATTLAAMIATEPLLLWQFGRLSLVAPLVNVLVLPAIPLAMAIGALVMGLGMIWSGLAGAAAPLADGLLRWILGVIDRGAAAPAALINIPDWAALLLAALLSGIIIRSVINYAQKTHPLNI